MAPPWLENDESLQVVADALWLTTNEFEDESTAHTKLSDLCKEMLENDVVSAISDAPLCNLPGRAASGRCVFYSATCPFQVGTVKDGCPLLKARLEKEWLEEIGVIPDAGQFHKVCAMVGDWAIITGGRARERRAREKPFEHSQCRT